MQSAGISLRTFLVSINSINRMKIRLCASRLFLLTCIFFPIIFLALLQYNTFSLAWEIRQEKKWLVVATTLL